MKKLRLLLTFLLSVVLFYLAFKGIAWADTLVCFGWLFLIIDCCTYLLFETK